MPQIIFNTLTRTKEVFTPQEPGHVKIYVCGPTVYDLSHIGHARVYVAFDTIVRFLRRDQKVTYVRNFTDVDDKIIKRALDSNDSPESVAEKNIAEFNADMQRLGVLPADEQPRVTKHIDDIVQMIGVLVDKDHAYEAGGDVFFAVEKFEGYGSLSKRSLEDMEAGIRVEVSDKKRHPMDFVLWKAAKPQEPSWDSPWGKGRPGWHIECSAMAKHYLGDTFDLHGGGRDLTFPHHENEIAQSQAANAATFARAWLHGGLVNIDNVKMSKSLGNFFTIRQVLEKFDPLVLRYYLMATHYRSAIAFSDHGLKEADGRVKYLYETLLRIDAALAAKAQDTAAKGPFVEGFTNDIVARFETAMQDDFNTPLAIGNISDAFKMANEILLQQSSDKLTEAHYQTLHAIRQSLNDVGRTLAMFDESPQSVLDRLSSLRTQRKNVDAAKVESLIEQRKNARAVKDFAKADAIRKELDAMGVVVHDGLHSTAWEVC